MTDTVTPPEPTAPPLRLVENGKVNFGTFGAPVAEINLLDAWSGVGRLLHASRVKEWQAFQLANRDYFVLGAVYDTKVLGLLQVLVVDKATGRIRRFEHKVPTTSLRVARGMQGTTSQGQWRGLRVTVANQMQNGIVQVDAEHVPAGRGRVLGLQVLGHCKPTEAAHLVICHPFPDGNPLYSNKTMMPASGSLTMPDIEIRFDVADSTLILDDHKGHYPSPMVYDWATGFAVTEQGRVGFNLTHNQVRDPGSNNENVVFHGTTAHRLPPVSFERPHGVHGPWHIRDQSGAVDVTFRPTVSNQQRVGPRGALADYHGPFGWFTGAISVGDTRFGLDGYFGMGEQKNIRL